MTEKKMSYEDLNQGKQVWALDKVGLLQCAVRLRFVNGYRQIFIEAALANNTTGDSLQ